MKQDANIKNISFHSQLREKLNLYVHSVYAVSKKFPKDELFGVTSQLRRSALSVMLNYIEGYARMKSRVHRNFLEISYGSLQESKYLLNFSFVEHYMNETDYRKLLDMANEIGRMLWGILSKMQECE